MRIVGDRLLDVLGFVGEFTAVTARGLVPGNWRRTMRSEFALYLYQVGVRAIPVVLVVALLVGIGLVFQIVYWLRFAGQTERIGEFIVLALIRQIAPVGTSLIIIGRSGSVLLEEVGQLARSGHGRALASQGIDPIDLVLLPRAFANGNALLHRGEHIRRDLVDAQRTVGAVILDELRHARRLDRNEVGSHRPHHVATDHEPQLIGATPGALVVLLHSERGRLRLAAPPRRQSAARRVEAGGRPIRRDQIGTPCARGIDLHPAVLASLLGRLALARRSDG